jgi:2-(1,2-epoxy-1,2-dihydrophenyl)acetyl-CoA isomerase
MSDALIYTIENGIALITLNRPEAFNAFDDKQSFELQDALKAVDKDKTARVLILTGAGKAFCSGQDLKAISGQANRSLSDSLYKRYNPIIRAIRHLNIPVICRLNGVAAGAGASLALACDMIIASEQASLIEVFVNVGLVPDSGSSFFLPQLVGYQKAFELCTLGTKVTAAEALHLGLVNKVVAADELDATVDEIATRYAKAPTKAIGLMKKMLNKGMTSNLNDMLEYEAYCQEIAGRSADYKEGVTSFVEKRPAIFTGK